MFIFTLKYDIVIRTRLNKDPIRVIWKEFGVNELFLTTGEKIRQVRQQFHLKQGVFQNFGITQHYLSMIETNKRKAPRETLEDIYHALMILTERKIEEQYTLEEFLLSPEEQAKKWIEGQLEKGIVEDKIQNIIEVAKKYELVEKLLEIDQRLGIYYFEKKDYTRSIQYFHFALSRCIQLGINPHKIYLQFGRILRGIGRWDESLSNLHLAMEYAENEEQFKHAKLLIGITYYRMGKYEEALEVTEEFLPLEANVNPQFIVGARIIKEGVLRRRGQIEEGRALLIPLAQDNRFGEMIQYVYHSLGWNYIHAKLYKQALEILEQALPLRVSKLEKALTRLLIGSIYAEIDEHDIAQSIFNEVKDEILSSNSVDSKMLWFERQLDLYWKTERFDQVSSLFKHIKDLVSLGLFPERLLVELKSDLHKRVVPHIDIKTNQYAFFYNFLVL